MEEKQVGERLPNNPNAIMFERMLILETSELSFKRRACFLSWMNRKSWIGSGTQPET